MRIRMLVVAAVAAATALLGSTGPAGAADAPTAKAEAAKAAQSANADQAFATQAKTARITNSQASALKSEVNRYLKKTGGKQVALNKIEVKGNGTLLVAIPGEAHPRDFASGNGARFAADPCLTGAVYSGYFCVYSGTVYSGSYYYWYACGTRGMPWGGNGSWINDQTPGTRATFYNSSGGVYYTTPAPYSSNQSYNWTPVWNVKNC
jgi:hypothetical protein